MDASVNDLARAYASAETMRAIAMTDFPKIGHVAEQLEMVTVPVPRPAHDEVAIKLSASTIHIDEIYVAQGTALGRFYGPKKVSASDPYILGSTVSGTVVGLSKEVDRFQIGNDVIVIPNEKAAEHDSWATYRCVTQKMVMLKPKELSHNQAAAITLAGCVAKGAIDTAGARAGDRCLVVGASGAIGLLNIQFLKALGAHVTAVCSGKNAELLKAKGADEVIDYTKHRFCELPEVKASPFDIVFDNIGGREVEEDASKALKKSGKFVTIVGPVRYIGEQKLSWPKVIKVIGYVLWRMLSTKFGRGPRYLFSLKFPRLVIAGTMNEIVRHGVAMPTETVVPFELEPIRSAVQLVSTHRARGRVLIDFTGTNALQDNAASK